MKRFKSNKKKWIILGILLLTITIGYAALGTTLNINGTTGISNATWDIHWNNVQVKSGSVSIGTGDQAATITQGNNQEVTYAVTLNTPGDFYEFTVDALNAGSIDGMIDTITSTYKIGNGETTPITSNNLPAYLNYTVTYSDGVAIAQNHKLEANSTETYKVRIEFKKDIDANQLPESAQSILFSFAVNYVQADDTAEEVVHGLTGTRYTTNKYINGNDNEYVWIGQKPTENITLYNTVTEAKAAFSNRPFYLKHELENDIVKDSYVCFEKDSNTYCLRGQATYEKVNNNWQCKSEFYDSENNKCLSTYYESNKTILKNAFGESTCTQYSSDLYCSEGGLGAGAYESGYVYVRGDSAECYVGSGGGSRCNG